MLAGRARSRGRFRPVRRHRRLRVDRGEMRDRRDPAGLQGAPTAIPSRGEARTRRPARWCRASCAARRSMSSSPMCARARRIDQAGLDRRGAASISFAPASPHRGEEGRAEARRVDAPTRSSALSARICKKPSGLRVDGGRQITGGHVQWVFRQLGSSPTRVTLPKVEAVDGRTERPRRRARCQAARPRSACSGPLSFCDNPRCRGDRHAAAPLQRTTQYSAGITAQCQRARCRQSHDPGADNAAGQAIYKAKGSKRTDGGETPCARF